MLDAWLDAVVLLQVGPSLCAGALLADDHHTDEGEVSPGPTDRVVATAYHCVASGLRPMVRFRDGTERLGTVYARDAAHDLALIAVPAEGEGLRLREDTPTIGETVYGLGHPYGQATGGKLTNLLVWSASRGIVSGVGPWLIQTDTALNPGNSGGPLVDEEGRIVGIVSRKIKAEGVSFAARADRVAELRAAPDMGTWFGGSWGVGVGFFQGERSEFGGNLMISVRERLVARGWLGLALGDGEPFGRVTLQGRQRFARGPLSTTLDLGVGGGWFDGEPVPFFAGRVAIAGVAFGAELIPGTWAWTLTLDLEWPGALGVF